MVKITFHLICALKYYWLCHLYLRPGKYLCCNRTTHHHPHPYLEHSVPNFQQASESSCKKKKKKKRLQMSIISDLVKILHYLKESNLATQQAQICSIYCHFIFILLPYSSILCGALHVSPSTSKRMVLPPVCKLTDCTHIFLRAKTAWVSPDCCQANGERKPWFSLQPKQVNVQPLKGHTEIKLSPKYPQKLLVQHGEIVERWGLKSEIQPWLLQKTHRGFGL